MKSSNQEREYDKFRSASGNLSKVAVSVEQDNTSPVPVYFTENGESLNLYDEQLSVAGLASENIINYTVPLTKGVEFKNLHISGDNKSIFSILVNDVVILKHRIWFTKFSDSIPLNIDLIASDNIKITVENKTNSTADFNATLQGSIFDE